MRTKKKFNLFGKAQKVTAKILSMAFIASLLITTASCSKEEPILPGDASIISFMIDDVSGVINETDKTITVELAAGMDLTMLEPVIVISAGASITPASGLAVDFSNPVVYTVTDTSGTVINTYSVTVSSAALRKMAFIGQAAENTDAAWAACAGTDYDLKDDQTAASWFMGNMASSTSEVAYLSFEQVAGGADLSQYHAIWIQFDGGTWGGVVASFPNNGEGKSCLLNSNGVQWDVTCDDLNQNFINAVKSYYENGGNILFGNYAGAMVDEIGVVSSPDLAPNNSWGGPTVDGGATASAWMVRWAGDQNSPMFEGIILGTDDNIPAPAFVLIEAGGEKKNRSNQYNLNFGPWAPNGDSDPLADRRASFESMTGAQILVENGGKNEPQMVMWNTTGNKGTVVAMLGGTFDWYIGETMTPTDRNLKTLTKNTLNYLVSLAIGE